MSLQRLVGNGAAARVLGRRETPRSEVRAQSSRPVLQREPAVAAADGDVDLVRRWIATGETRENILTDRLFFSRHPTQVGSRLAPGSDLATEWIEIRQEVVRPALDNPQAAAPVEAAASDGSAADPDGEATALSAVDDAVNAVGGAVDSILSAGEDLFEDAVESGADLVDWAVEGGTGMGEAVLDFFGVGGEPEEVQEPEAIVEVPLEPEHERGDTFLSQRDNRSKHVKPGVSCSPTSFTMALIELHGGDEARVKARTIELINGRGGNTDYSQTEDLVIELLQITDWKAATAEKPAFFPNPKGWAEWAKSAYKGRYYKDPNAQQYVASLYPGMASDAAETYNVHQREDWEPVVAALDEGAVVTAQGSFTSSGHVVSIVDSNGDGLVINDPYGLWLRGYGYQVKNGSAPPALKASDMETFRRRAKTNPALLEIYESYHSDSPPDAGYDAWGQRNFYSWEDAEKLDLGVWVSVMRGADAL
jgi:hypothetical protein